MGKSALIIVIFALFLVATSLGFLIFQFLGSDIKFSGDASNSDSKLVLEKPVYACVENWNCGEWSQCDDGIQERKCVDLNSCGTFESKPAESQKCEIPEATEIMVGCGDDLECFIEAAEDDKEAKVILETSIDFLGMIISQESRFKFEEDGNGYLFKNRILDIKLEFSQELIQNMLDAGSTTEEIDSAEEDAEKNAELSEGLKHVCELDKGNLDDFIDMLERWDDCDFDGGAVCTSSDGQWICEYTGDYGIFDKCSLD